MSAGHCPSCTCLAPMAPTDVLGNPASPHRSSIWSHEPDPRWEVSMNRLPWWTDPKAWFGWRWSWSLWWVKVSPYHGEEYRQRPVLMGGRPFERYAGRARSQRGAMDAARLHQQRALADHFAYRKAERDARHSL